MYTQFNPKHSAIAKRILSKSKPNKDYIPKLKIYWSIKHGSEIYYWEPGSKTIKTIPFEMKGCCMNSFRSSQREIKTSYFRYYPKYNALECGMLTINGLRKKPDEIRDWEFHPDNKTYPHFMIFFGDPYPYGPDGNEVLSNPKDRYYNTEIYHLLYTTYSRYQELGKNVVIKHKSVLEFLNGNNINLYYQESGYAWNFAQNYYKKYAPRPITQKIIDVIEINNSLKEKEIKEVIPANSSVTSIADIAGEVIPANISVTSTADIAWCENINGYAVIRSFSLKTSPISFNSFYRRECVRYFIAPNKTITVFYKQQRYNWVTADYEGKYQWEKVNGAIFSYVDGGYKYDLRNFESIANLPQLKYLNYTFNPNNKGLVNLGLVFGVLLHPILEQMHKAGYPELAKRCLCDTISSEIKSLFGTDATEKKSLTIYQNLKVNRVILKKMEEIAKDKIDGPFKQLFGILPIIKEFCGCDVRTLDAKTINDWFDFCQELYENSIKLVYCQYTSLHKFAGRDTWNFDLSNITEEQKEGYRKEIRHLFHLWRKEHANTYINGIAIWKDTITLLRAIDNEFVPQNFNLLSMRNYQDLTDTHDYLVAYTNSLQNMNFDKQEQSKRFKKMQEIRKEHYELIGENFSVLVPEKLSQIVDEGIALHHCVKTYTDRVASGETTILFFRRSNDKNTPFYTIEVRNNVIIQIHGFGNKWIGNDLDAARFMYRYCKYKNIHCNMDILTNKGQCYCASRQNHWSPDDIINN